LKNMAFAVLALALGTTISAPALAHENPQNFPMPAAEFQEHVQARLERARSRMESAITAQNMTEAQAKEVRARFDAIASNVGVEVQKAVADGTVTLEEAKAVRAVARQLRPHHAHHPQS
jgi:hypothetical protein